jgi:hypothetical protein
MVYYKKSDHKIFGYQKSKTTGKMYDALLLKTGSPKLIRVPFGDNSMGNFHDKTGLNLYPHLIHGNKKRRKAFRARHKGYLKEGYYSPSFFSYYYLW